MTEEAKLTARQQEVLDFICECKEKNGMPPTLQEIATHLGLNSLNGVKGHLDALEKKGFIERAAGKSRGLIIRKWTKILDSTVGRIHGRHSGTKEIAVGMPVYWLGWHTKNNQPLLEDKKLVEIIEQTILQVSVEHNWEMLSISVMPTRVEMKIKVFPDHSPDNLITHFKWYIGWERILSQGLKGINSLWSKGYAVATDEEDFKKNMQALLTQKGIS